MANEWLEEVKKELLENSVVSKPVIPEVSRPMTDKYSQNLFLLALSLSVFLIALYQDKTGVRVFDPNNWNLSERIDTGLKKIKDLWPDEEQIVDIVEQKEIPVKISDPCKKVQTNNDLNKFKKELEKTKTDLIRYANHQRLLATIINNNAAAVKFGRPNETILLNKDWTISSLPTLLFVDAEDIKFLNKFIKK